MVEEKKKEEEELIKYRFRAQEVPKHVREALHEKI